MHAGLAALAEEGAGAGIFTKLLGKVKSLATNREAIRLAAGKQLILARSFFSPRSFSKPESRDVLLQRVRGNFGHYRTLYGLLFVALLAYTVLSSPLLLLGLTLLAGAWAYAFVLTSPETPITVAGFELRRREKLFALAPFSVIVVTLCGLINSLVYVLVLTCMIALPHASFHEVAELDALDALELEGLQAGVPMAV